MERNHQFEIQYLLTVTIAAVSFLASPYLRSTFDSYLGFGFIILIAVHVVLLNIIYGADRIEGWEMKIVKRYRSYSDWTLIAVTAAIPYIILSSLSLFFVNLIWGCADHSLVYILSQGQYHFCSGSIILLAYVTPFLVTLGLMDKFKRSIIPSLTSIRDINFVVAPPDITIYSEAEDTEPLFVKIENFGPEEIVVELEIELPDKVKWQTDNQWHNKRYDQTHQIKSKRQLRVDMNLEYQGAKRRSDLITVTLNHKDGKREEEVPVLLEP